MKSKARKIIYYTLKRCAYALGFTVILAIALFAVFNLYGITKEPMYYAFALAAFLLTIYIILSAVRVARECELGREIQNGGMADLEKLPKPSAPIEEALTVLSAYERGQREQIERQTEALRQDGLDYYSAWIHKIKTPMAVMRFLLSDGEKADLSKINAELIRIERYADMALEYIRLGSETNDLVIESHELDGILKEVIGKYAPLFIYKKLALNYNPTGVKVITDKKWFTVIIEQLISNAVKYTQSGGVTVEMDKNDTLIIADTGAGISKADLPRIFEKGYTGYNGRGDNNSSGLGLYLTKRAADKLGLKLTAESEKGKGSRFGICLKGHMDKE